MGFVVGLTAGFLGEDGTPAFPDFDLSPLERGPGIVLRACRRAAGGSNPRTRQASMR